LQEPFEPGLDTTDAISPLRRFTARLEGYYPIDKPGDRGIYKVIQFKFVELDVSTVESLTPWLFPVAEIVVSYSTSTLTRWDALAKSYRKLAPEANDLRGLKGKMQTWAMLPAKRRNRDDEGNWGEITEDMWQIEAVEGLGSVQEAEKDFDAHLVAIADGKDEKAFNAAALADEKVRLNPSVVTAITERKLLDTLVVAGRLTRDAEGVLHKVEASG